MGFLEKWFKTYDIQAEIIELNCTAADAFEMLRQGELDGYVALDAYGTTGTAIPEDRIGSSDFFFSVNKDRSDLLQELDVALIRIQEENRFFSQQLSQKYISTFGANVYLNDAESLWLKQHGTIRIGYQDNYLAFCACDLKTGKLTGVLKDYLDVAADCLWNAHLDFEAIAYPTADAAMEALKNGEIDCMFPSNLSAYDGEILGIIMTPPIIRSEAYALVRKLDHQAFSEKEHVTVAVEPTDINYHSVVADKFPDWQIKEFSDTLSCLRAVSFGEADCYLSNNYQYNSMRRDCEKFGLTLLATGKGADFYIAIDGSSKELYSILTRTTSFISDANMNAALTYYTAEGAKVSLGELILDNLPIVIGAILLLIALILMVIFQHRMIVAQRKENESKRMIEDLNKQIFTDALTQVKNKAGFDRYMKQVQEQLDKNEVMEVAIGVLDCNDLKLINDKYGHNEGNLYLKAACSLICRIFKYSPVFRIGGDEFVVVLEKDDFHNRKELISQFEKAQEAQSALAKNRWEHVSIAVGVSEYDPQFDESLSDTFRRADKLMYENKLKLKVARQNAR